MENLADNNIFSMVYGMFKNVILFSILKTYTYIEQEGH